MSSALSGWDPLGHFATAAADSALTQFEDSMMDAVTNVLKVVSTFWMYLPSPETQSSSLETITRALGWYVGFFALIGVFIALIKMVVTNDFKAGMPAVKMIFNLIIVTAVYATGASLLIQAGDAFAPWILDLAAGKDANMNDLITKGAIATVGIGPALFALTIGFLGSLANVLLMIVRGVMVTIIMAFLPVLAASSGTEMGNQAFKKAQAYLLSFILFKPVAAVIYALGLLLLKDQDPTGQSLGDYSQAIYQIGVGMLTLLMACALLPTMVKFIVPVAGQGVSGMFSGAGLATAIVAAGAPVVALGASAGGAALAGGAAASSAAGASTATATGSGTAQAASATAASGRAVSSPAPQRPEPGQSSPSRSDLVASTMREVNQVVSDAARRAEELSSDAGAGS